MAIVIERTTSFAYTTGANVTTYFSGSPSVGNSVIATSHWYWSSTSDPGAATVTDDATGGSNSYSTDKHQPSDYAAHGTAVAATISRAQIARTKSGLGVTSAVNGSQSVCVAMEVSGLHSSTPVAGSGGIDSDDATSPFQVSTGTLSQTGELIVGAGTFNGVGTEKNIANSWSVTPTTLFEHSYAETSSGEDSVAAYYIAPSTAAIDVGFSCDEVQPNRVAIAFVRYAPAAASNPLARAYGPDGQRVFTGLRM
jgi:hypothetical protein